MSPPSRRRALPLAPIAYRTWWCAILVWALPSFSAEHTRVHEVTAEKLKQQFHYAPPPLAADSAQSQTVSGENPPAVVLDRLTVIQSFERRQLEQSIAREDRRLKAHRFNLKDGGTIKEFRHGELQLGLWPTSGGLNFLKFQW